jgi:hypothetical protein
MTFFRILVGLLAVLIVQSKLTIMQWNCTLLKAED